MLFFVYLLHLKLYEGRIKMGLVEVVNSVILIFHLKILYLL